MGTRSQGRSARVWSALGALVFVAAIGGAAWADAKGDLAKQTKAAMEAYDGFEYEAATKALKDAIAAAKKAKLDKDPAFAKAHVFLGIASFAAGDADGAKAAFAVAVAVDPKVQIDVAYKSPDLVKLLEAAREGAGGGAGGGDAECEGVTGLQHTIIDAGKTNTELPIEALVGNDLKPGRVAVMYRTEGTADFVEGKLTKTGGCKYTGVIPAAAMKGSMMQYYVAAYDTNNRVLSGKGSSGAPNLIELTAGTGVAGGGDGEDPINGKKGGGGGGGGGGSGGGSISGGVLAGGKAPKIFLAVTGGTGVGYVTGTTEANNQVQNCCLGNSLVVIWPELGYQVSSQLSIGLAGRIGLPIGANVDPPDAKHSTVAPGAVVRIRYALSPSGEGLRFMGQIGGGVMRNTIKLEMQPGGGDTDIVAQGPLLVGAGIGFKKSLSNSLAFIADLSALAGIAVVDKLGTAKLNSGVGGDFTLGLAVGF